MKRLILVLLLLVFPITSCGESQEEKEAREDARRAYKAKMEKEAEEKERQEHYASEAATFISTWSKEIQAGEKIVNRLLKNKNNEIHMPISLEDMLLVFYVRKVDWNKLKQTDKERVCLYIKSLIPSVKGGGAEKYATLSSTAPIYNRYISAAPNMCFDCWSIVTSDMEKTLVVGDELFGRKRITSGISFSEFSKNRYDTKKYQGQDTRGKAALAAMTPQVDAQTSQFVERGVMKYLGEHYKNYSIKRSSAVFKSKRNGKEVWLMKVNFILNGREYFGEFYVDKWSDTLFKVIDADIRVR